MTEAIESGDRRKRAELIAEEIESRIVDAGWPIGQIIGSETSLIDEFEVSRGVLREAVRLLEHHSTAYMRRGPGGGLVVTAPEAGAVRRAAALYLRYRRADVNTLVEARRVLELNCLDLVAQRIRDPQVVTRLGRVLDAEVGATKAAGSTRYLRGFHLELASLSGNPAIGLFAEILMELQSDFTDEPRRAPTDQAALAKDANASHRAHRAIYRALIEGDPDRARSAMSKHLTAISTWTAEHAYHLE
ncbi:FadR/GntR family transcriptional regulator [Amycolatopsis sp. GM8]|uniref:FadR/GntR family transcriptional regulator n=1 Tax=Amycolatopsis sp. GM8 TaxID=2896530 RepID=UPI001F2A0A36|nr:FCD domain-containing protein [Amycolatopsis sp. GM8]